MGLQRARILALLVAAGRCGAITAPDVSLETFPLAYYGANWNRSAENLELLSRVQIVILMQEDGPCWHKCCPNAGNKSLGRGQCGPHDDATTFPGCDSSCDQLGTQLNTFRRLKSAARGAGRPEPHCLMYLNSVYLWPFDKSSGQGDTVKVLDVHGKPHAENCDPGVFPSFFWGWDKPAGKAAWMATVNRTILVENGADGAYVDCKQEIPLHCNETSGVCTAKRNGGWKSINEQVTSAQVAAYKQNKLSGLATAADWVVGQGGSWFGSAGQNMDIIRIGPPATFLPDVARHIAGKKYVVVTCHGQPWNSPLAPENLTKPVQCSATCVSQFLMGVEPGMFLMCGGLLNSTKARPLGNATEPASHDAGTGIWSRRFPSGTVATYNERTDVGTVTW